MGWRLKLASVQKVSQRLTEDTILFCKRVKLLHISPQPNQEASDTDRGSASLAAHAVCAADVSVT
jgi:hypothetical protein